MTFDDSLIYLGNEIMKKQKFDLFSSKDADIVTSCIDEYMTQTLSDLERYQIGIKLFYHGLQYLHKVFRNAELVKDCREDVASGMFQKVCRYKNLICVRFELAGQAYLVCLDAHITEADDDKTEFSEIVHVSAIAKDFSSYVIESVLSAKEKKMMETMLSSIPGLNVWNYGLQESELFYCEVKHRYSGVYIFFYVLMTLQKIQDIYFRRVYLDHIRQKFIDDDILIL